MMKRWCDSNCNPKHFFRNADATQDETEGVRRGGEISIQMLSVAKCLSKLTMSMMTDCRWLMLWVSLREGAGRPAKVLLTRVVVVVAAATEEGIAVNNACIHHRITCNRQVSKTTGKWPCLVPLILTWAEVCPRLIPRLRPTRPDLRPKLNLHFQHHSTCSNNSSNNININSSSNNNSSTDHCPLPLPITYLQVRIHFSVLLLRQFPQCSNRWQWRWTCINISRTFSSTASRTWVSRIPDSVTVEWVTTILNRNRTFSNTTNSNRRWTTLISNRCTATVFLML